MKTKDEEEFLDNINTITKRFDNIYGKWKM